MVAGRHPPGYPVSIEPSAEDIRRAHQAEQYRIQALADEAAKKRRAAEAAAVVERQAKTTH